MAGRSGQSDWHRQQQAMAREAERQQKTQERARVAAEKERKRQHSERRQAEVAHKNDALAASLQRLETILQRGLGRSARIDLTALRRESDVGPPQLGTWAHPVERPQWEEYQPRSPGMISRGFGGRARYAQRMEKASQAFKQDMATADLKELTRQQRVVELRRQHAEREQQATAAVAKHNAAINEHIEAVASRTKHDVETYLGRVLARIPLPDGFPRNAEVTFNPRSEQAVLRFELPPRDVVPTVAGYRYLPTKDEERTSARPKREIADLYRDAISQVALLCIRDLFDGDQQLSAIGFNGHVHATNPGTGEGEYPCIVSVNVDRSSFPADANLRKVTPTACVQHLNAIVSGHPYDLEPIEPILDFDLSKYSFVDGFDAVSTLDSRPDLMQMSPTNFEHLVRQIFEAQGAEGWTTGQSKDDGVDAVITKRTPLMGGLSIVQAKRYSKVVGMSHIRELAGAIEEKKAGWGILITTSWFSKGCWDKAREHGRMELIDGERLTYLVKEYLDKDVLIGIQNRPHGGGSV